MFANLLRRLRVRKALRRVDRHVKQLLRAHGGYPPSRLRICGPGYEGYITKTGTVSVTISGPIETIRFDREVQV